MELNEPADRTVSRRPSGSADTVRTLSRAAGEQLVAVEDSAGDLEVTVLSLTGPLESGSVFGRGQGLLSRDPSVAVTFLVDQEEFVRLRAGVLNGAGDVHVALQVADVTAIDIRH